MTDQIVRRLEDRDDLSLVLLARGGEQRAFETLFARHRHRFVSLVVRVPGDWTVTQADGVRADVERAVCGALEDVDVTAQVAPRG